MRYKCDLSHLMIYTLSRDDMPSLSAWIKKERSNCFVLFLEVPPRFELGNESFADSCLTAWPRYHMKLGTHCVPNLFGAGDEARTRYLHLGKVALYRMSYTRISVPNWEPWCLRSESNQRHVDFQSTALPTELQRHVEQSIKLCSDAFIWRPGTDSNRRPPA